MSDIVNFVIDPEGLVMCPFCGASQGDCQGPVLVQGCDFFVACDTCGATTRACATPHEAREAWNGRSIRASKAIVEGNASREDTCEHGFEQGDWCETCNSEAKAAREDPENRST